MSAGDDRKIFPVLSGMSNYTIELRLSLAIVSSQGYLGHFVEFYCLLQNAFLFQDPCKHFSPFDSLLSLIQVNHEKIDELGENKSGSLSDFLLFILSYGIKLLTSF
jgi:hypothetical protein